MDAAKVGADDEPPSLLWGLDPVFSAYARLYVKDILQMQESRQVPGVYIYNSHPLYQVDVLGTVVFKREREDFFCYGVDDSTGVINCLCWKNERWREQSETVKPGGRALGGAPGGFNVEEQLRRLQEAQRGSWALEIGELLRVRGSVKTSRQQREIMASAFYKVSDPVMAVQIAWLADMPRLYRECYDKPFQVPGELDSHSTDSLSFPALLGRGAQTLKDFIKEKEVKRFRPYDVEHLLHPLVSRLPDKPAAEQEPCAAGPSVPAQIRRLLKESLEILRDEGLVFRKVLSQDEVYNVTEHDKDLLAVTRDVIREDSKRAKYAEKGCHVLHILSSVRQSYSRNLSREALEVVLKFLECNSDIISTTDCHYTVI